MAKQTNTTATATATNASTTVISILADLQQGRIVIRNENRDRLAELFGEELALPNPPLGTYLPNGLPIVTGWSPSIKTLSTFFYASTKQSMGETPEARKEAKRLALALIMDYIPYGIVVHATRDTDNEIDNIIVNFRSTIAATRDTMVTQLSATDTKSAEQYINLDKVTFYDFDKRGHWVGNQFLPSTTSTATTFAIPPTEDIA